MSIQQGNPGIVTKDLQLYYNRESQNSFRGESTVNFFSVPNYTLQKEGNHSTSFVTSTTTGVPDLVVEGNKQVYSIPEYYTLVATGAWVTESNRLIIYPKSANYAPSGTYRISFYARSISGNTALGFAFYSNAINNTVTLTTKWQRFSANSTYNNGAMIIEFGNINAGSMICQIACIQVESKSYATPFTLPVLWSPNLTNVTSTSGHTTMTKSGSDSWTNARVFSSEGYNEPCYVSFKANATNKAFMIALNSDPLTGINYSNLDYAWYCTDTADSKIYESNVDRGSAGSYTTSSVFEIIYDGTNISYYRDGGLARTVTRAGSGPLYLDSSFYTLNSQVVNLSFGPLSQINRFSNYAIGGGGLLDLSGNGYKVDLTSSAIVFDSGGYYFNANAQGVITTPVVNSILDNLSNNSHTYECWFKLLGTPPGLYSGYFFGRQGYHSGLSHRVSNPNIIDTTTWYNDVTATGMSTTLSLNTWYHGVFINDVENAIAKLYINGSLSTSQSLTKQLRQYTSTTPYYIGAASTEYASNSIVSTARAYNRALTSAEITRNFNAGRKAYGI